MEILLVFPWIEHGAIIHSDKGSWSSVLFGYPIITLPHLAGITPRQHTVKIVNENYEDLHFDEPADLIGITSYTMTAPHVYELADEFRPTRTKSCPWGGITRPRCPTKQNHMRIVSCLGKLKQSTEGKDREVSHNQSAIHEIFFN